MERAGLCWADFDGDVVEVWPENWRAFKLLCDIRTQWRGAGNRIGLDYGVMFAKMDRMGLNPAEYDSMEADMRAMEAEAIRVM